MQNHDNGLLEALRRAVARPTDPAPTPDPTPAPASDEAPTGDEALAAEVARRQAATAAPAPETFTVSDAQIAGPTSAPAFTALNDDASIIASIQGAVASSGRAAPTTGEAYHGDPAALEASVLEALQSYGHDASGGPRMLTPEQTSAELNAIFAEVADVEQKKALTAALTRAATYPGAPQAGGPHQIL